jgi:hypothetical protein
MEESPMTSEDKKKIVTENVKNGTNSYIVELMPFSLSILSL